MKKTLIILMLICFLVTLVGCGNNDFIDTHYTYDYAYIKLPTGEIIEGKVQKWSDYDGDQLQIKINGTIYLVHSENATMIVNP